MIEQQKNDSRKNRVSKGFKKNRARAGKINASTGLDTCAENFEPIRRAKVVTDQNRTERRRCFTFLIFWMRPAIAGRGNPAHLRSDDPKPKTLNP